MERRKALATAGAVTMTAVAGVIAVGANFGIFGLADDNSKVGNFTPVDATATTAPPVVDTQVIETPPPVSSTPSYEDDDYDDNDDSDDSGYEREGEGEEREVEDDD